VRTRRRLAAQARKAVGDVVGHHGRETLGLLVHPLPGQREHVREESLEDAVTANEPQRDTFARRGEENVVAFVRRKTGGVECRDPIRRIRAADTEPLRDLVNRHLGMAVA
jgi:hypothetical protein